MRCFTIGHGNRTIEEFLALLAQYKISEVIDIRSYPESLLEHFNRSNLERILRARKIKYTHSPELGEFQQFRGETFKKGFSNLIRKIKSAQKTGENLVIMCAEKKPKQCHRWQLSQLLEQMGVNVEHIIELGQLSLLNFKDES
jgi:uncharacterized protein (DUF488 family)